jgi:YggT family protein
MNTLSLLGIKILLFVISILFNFYEFFVLMRFLLQAVKADFRNPFCQFLIKITAFPLHPMRRVIPGFFGLDLAALVLLYLLIWIELSLTSFITYDYWSPFTGVRAILESFSFYLNTVFFMVICNALLSWIPQARLHPNGILIHLLCEPYLKLARKVLPNMGAFDFSPVLVIIVSQILQMIIQYFLR